VEFEFIESFLLSFVHTENAQLNLKNRESMPRKHLASQNAKKLRISSNLDSCKSDVWKEIQTMSESHEYPQPPPVAVETSSSGSAFNGRILAIIMVGLPARGKTYCSRKLARYLTWLGSKARIFNVGNYRRDALGAGAFTYFEHGYLDARRLTLIDVEMQFKKLISLVSLFNMHVNFEFQKIN
jgi:hypothetical protein